MTLPVEAIVHAIRASQTPEAAANLIHLYEEMQNKVVERKHEADGILRCAQAKVAQMMQQDLCHHPVTKRHNDPSGGSDSHESCLICGDILKDKPARFT